MDRYIEKWKDRKKKEVEKNRQKNESIENGQIEKWIDRQIEIWIDRKQDTYRNGQIERRIDMTSPINKVYTVQIAMYIEYKIED